MEKVCLGKAVKLHGYMGEVKIITHYDNDFDIKKIEKMYDKFDNEYKVKRIMKNTDGIYVGFFDVDLEKAKSFIGNLFYIDRDLVKEKILIEDLKNSNVFFEDGLEIGRVVDIQDYGSAEVFFIKLKNGKELMFPNVKGLIKTFDYKLKKIVIVKDKLKEVSDYED